MEDRDRQYRIEMAEQKLQSAIKIRDGYVKNNDFIPSNNQAAKKRSENNIDKADMFVHECEIELHNIKHPEMPLTIEKSFRMNAHSTPYHVSFVP